MTSDGLSHGKQQVPHIEDTGHTFQYFLLQLLGMPMAQANSQAGRSSDGQGRLRNVASSYLREPDKLLPPPPSDSLFVSVCLCLSVSPLVCVQMCMYMYVCGVYVLMCVMCMCEFGCVVCVGCVCAVLCVYVLCMCLCV